MRARIYSLLLFLVSLLVTNIANAQERIPQKLLELPQGVSISIGWNSLGNTVIAVKGQGLAGSVAFALENPARIVVDLPSVKANINRTMIPKGGAEILKVRVASHPDKFRAVFDLASSAKSDFSLVTKDSMVEVTLGGASLPRSVLNPGKSEVIAEEAGTPTRTAVPSPKSQETKNASVSTVTITPAPSASEVMPSPSPSESLPTRSPSLTPHLDTVPITTPVSPSPTVAPSGSPKLLPTLQASNISEQGSSLSSGVKLLEMKFDYIEPDHQPVVRLVLNSSSEFKLVKQDETTFVLTIPRASLSNSQAGLIQFAPQDFVGLGYLMPKVENGDLKIVVGVERNQRLASANKGSELLLRVISRSGFKNTP